MVVTHSVEDYNTVYVHLPFIRLIFHERRYVGWYRP